MNWILVFLSAIAALRVPITFPNTRPIIGLLTSPSEFPDIYSAQLPTAYVKWIESAGARVVVIHHEEPSHVLDYLLSSVNAVVITGDVNQLKTAECLPEDNTYLAAVKQILSKVIEDRETGSYMALWASSLGMTSIQQLVSGTCSLANVNVTNTMLTTYLTAEGHFSQMIEASDSQLRSSLQTFNLVYHNHEYGTRLTSYAAVEKLQQFFKVVSVSKDLQGEYFVSSIEGKTHPIFGVMWQPELPQFEWGLTGIGLNDHGAIVVAQYFANFFVSQARLNHQSFADEAAYQVFSPITIVPNITTTGGSGTYLFPKQPI